MELEHVRKQRIRAEMAAEYLKNQNMKKEEEQKRIANERNQEKEHV